MKTLFAAILAALLFLRVGALAQGPNDLNAGSQMVYSGSSGTLAWWGAAGNTYLIQTSDDLVNWSYLPVVESGSNSIIEWGFTSNSSDLFMKLEYINVAASQLSGAIFNGPEDISNGLPGDWELFYFGQLAVDPNMDPNGEGFTAMQDYENGNNPIADQVVSVGPRVGEYLFHETSGTIAHDLSYLHNNGSLGGGAAWASGGYDGQGAITFNGTNGVVSISNTGNQALPAAEAPFSFAVWFNANSLLSGTTSLISDETSSASGFEFGIDDTTSPPSLLISTSGSNAIKLETPFEPVGWTQAAVTYDGTTASLYLDGFEQTSGTASLVSNTNTITLGSGPSGTHPFAGAIEDLTLYQAALQPWDVNSLYNLSTTGTGPDISGMPNWWKYQYFGTLNVNPNGLVSWSGGQLTNLEAYQQGLSPVTYYDGQIPVLAIVSGSGQTGSPGGFVSAPLIVSVTDTNGNPLYDAPVTFTVTTGTGQSQASSTSVASGTVTALADWNGQAQVFFQLPTVVSSTSHITATTGTGISVVEVAFSEYADSGTGTYASPFAPSNVLGSMNADGSETISWQNNDSQSPIYVYELTASNTWTVASTLPAGTTSYTATGSAVGAVEIGNGYSPGGSTGDAGGSGGGGSGGGTGGSSGSSNPGGNPYAAIPTAICAAIDVSGTLSQENPVTLVALNDSNEVAFALSGTGYDTFGNNPTTDPPIRQTTEFDSYTWQNGVLSSKIVTAGMVVTGSNSTETDYWFRQPTVVTSMGNLYGEDVSYSIDQYGNLIDYSWQGAIFSNIGGVSQDMTSPNSVYGIDVSYPDCYPTAVSDNGVILGTGDLSTTNTSSQSIRHYFTFILSGGACTSFDPGSFTGVTTPSNFTLDSTNVDLVDVNNYGWAIGYSSTGAACVWTGSTSGLIQLAPMEAVTAISNNNQVVGVTGSTGYIWAQGSASQPISQYLPQAYQTEISNINPIDISGTNAVGAFGILFTAQYQATPNADAAPTLGGTSSGWSSGTFLLTVSSTASPVLEMLSLPPSVSTDLTKGVLNANGLVADTGSITTGTGSSATTTTNAALLLLPVEFSITQLSRSASTLTGGWNYSSLLSSGTLQSPEFYMTAKTVSLGGYVSLNILQDMHSTRTVTYSDGSYAYCSIPGYLADYDSRYPVVTSIDSLGNITCTFHDAPFTSIPSNPRTYLWNVEYGATPRDFATVQMGAGTPQPISQVNWSVFMAAFFEPSTIIGSDIPFNSTYQPQTAQAYSPNVGVTIYGATPSSTPVPPPRAPSANTYITTGTNWVESGVVAHKFTYPLQ
jgi:hypothetical protein